MSKSISDAAEAALAKAKAAGLEPEFEVLDRADACPMWWEHFLSKAHDKKAELTLPEYAAVIGAHENSWQFALAKKGGDEKKARQWILEQVEQLSKRVSMREQESEEYAGEQITNTVRGMYDEWKFTLDSERFVHRTLDVELKPSAFDAWYATKIPFGGQGLLASKLFCDRAEKDHIVATQTWQPNRPEIITGSFGTAFNRYRGTDLQPELGNVDPFYEPAEYVIPDDVARDYFFKWAAHLVQRPEEKPSTAPIIGSLPGGGKDSLLEPIRLAIGIHNCRDITTAELESGFNSWLWQTLLAVVQELSVFHKIETSERLKPVITPLPRQLQGPLIFKNVVCPLNLLYCGRSRRDEVFRARLVCILSTCNESPQKIRAAFLSSMRTHAPNNRCPSRLVPASLGRSGNRPCYPSRLGDHCLSVSGAGEHPER